MIKLPVLIVALLGCSLAVALLSRRQSAPAASLPLPVVAHSSPAPPPQKVRKVPPRSANELGRVPILMYHSIGEQGVRFDRHGLNLPVATFRKHLDMLHRNGFYPVNLRDLIASDLNVPEGKTPVVITFDDARASQFRYKKDGSIDPNCAVGVLDTMHRKYGKDWPQRAVFFVLPKSKYNPVPFHQEGKVRQKVQYLVKAGYEVANHSTSHRPMSRLNAKELAWEVKTCQEYFRQLDPGVTMDTMAVPYGIFPKTEALRAVLTRNGNRLVCMAWGDASYAPLDKRFVPSSVQRIGSEPGNIERWIKQLTVARIRPGSSLAPYVSDGDPNTLAVPQSRIKWVNHARLGSVRVLALKEPSLLKKPSVTPAVLTAARHQPKRAR